MPANLPSVDIDAPGVSTALAKRIKEDIDEYCARTYDDGPRRHLGASLIGHECKRHLWFIFRWAKHEKHSGRVQRLFNRGHREEARFIEWLEGIGFKLWFEDRESNPLMWVEFTDTYYLLSNLPEGVSAQDVTANKEHLARAKADGIQFNQYRISGAKGHFGGSLDGIAQLPPRYRIDEPILVEFKTNGTGKGFNDLGASGMAVSKPQHFAQTSTYGKEYKFRYVLYLNINKNDDDIHVELVKLDHNLGEQMKTKAEQIIFSQSPPPRLSDNPTFFKCKYCAMKGICHEHGAIEKNCRSCSKAKPVENADWFCEAHNGIIPKEYIANGCSTYDPII